ncbi:MAG TPA: hypothetical protein VG407_10660 [Caulobacteraceae bacterium]|nr:hypothetical protein [Caulobacteraceae bacterium]
MRPAAILAGALVLSISGAGRAAQPRQWICEGEADGANGAKVSMMWYVEADGTVIDRAAFWTPPSVTIIPYTPRVRLRGKWPLDFWISYDDNEATGLGKAASVTTTAADRPRPTARLTLDRVRAWPLSTDLLSPDGIPEIEPPKLCDFATDGGTPPRCDLGSDFNSELLTAVEAATVADLTVRRRDGHVIGKVRYILSARQQRDRLYRLAWSTAERAARHPTRCDKTMEPPPELVPASITPIVF